MVGKLATLVMFATVVASLPAQQSATPDAGLAGEHARAAQQAEKRNDFATAVQQYELVVRALPQNAEMQSDLGVALYFDHQLPQAINVFRRAIAINANLLAPHLFSGLAWYRLSSPEAAVPELEKAARINPSDVIARTWLGYTYVALFRYNSALEEFQAACRLDPNNVDVWYALGQTDLQVGKQATLQLLAIAPDGGRTWQLAGEQLLLQGDRKDALKDFEGALERRPDVPELQAVVAKMGGTAARAPGVPPSEHNKEDDLYRRAHNAEVAAQAAFDRVVEIAPDSYRAHEIMAAAFAARQQTAQAIEEYQTVLELEPDLPGIHEAIGNILLQNARLPEALKEFQAELQIQPRSASVLANAGQVMLMMGNDAGAGKMLSRALSMEEPPPEVHLLLGKLALRRRDYRSAISELTHYASIKQNDSTAYYLLARAYRAVGDKEQMDRALSLFQKTSQAARVRSRAQQELESFSDPRSAPDATLGVAQRAAR